MHLDRGAGACWECCTSHSQELHSSECNKDTVSAEFEGANVGKVGTPDTPQTQTTRIKYMSIKRHVEDEAGSMATAMVDQLSIARPAPKTQQNLDNET